MSDVASHLRKPLIDFLLSMADEKLFLGHRNGDWTGLGPFLEEDIAFSNIAQDEIAHAQELYKLAAAVSDAGADAVVQADRLAYARGAGQRLNATLVEVADEFDWAVALARQFLFDHYDMVRLPRLQASSYQPLADLAGKMIQEVRFHIEHFDGWVTRLGQGTSESRDRIQQALDGLWSHAMGLFEALPEQQALVETGLYPGNDDDMRNAWLDAVGDVLKTGGLHVPTVDVGDRPGGRSGAHTPHLQDLLADLAEVYHCEPDASW